MNSFSQLHRTLKPRQKVQYVVVARIIFDVNCVAYYLHLCFLNIQHAPYSTFLFSVYPMATIGANFSNLAEKWASFISQFTLFQH
jgi:hypothetical protein